MVLYILLFTFLDEGWKYKRFWTKWSQAFSKCNLLFNSLMNETSAYSNTMYSDITRGKAETCILNWSTHIFKMQSLWFFIPDRPWYSLTADKNIVTKPKTLPTHRNQFTGQTKILLARHFLHNQNTYKQLLLAEKWLDVTCTLESWVAISISHMSTQVKRNKVMDHSHTYK